MPVCVCVYPLEDSMMCAFDLASVPGLPRSHMRKRMRYPDSGSRTGKAWA